MPLSFSSHISSVGKQVNFFLLPGDLIGIEQAIRQTGQVMFLPGTVPEPEIAPVSTIQFREHEMGAVGLRLYITLDELASGIRFRQVPEQGYFIVEPGSPVIELDRCYFDGKVLRRGRLYFFTGPGFQHRFIHWGDSVLRAVRRVLTRNPALGSAYFGAVAEAWIQRTHAAPRVGGNEFALG
jgi:hypothetical protein